MRRFVKGKQHLILAEDQWGGYVSIEVEKLTAKMEDLFPETCLGDKRTLIAAIKADVDDKMGWKKHKKELRKEGFDV